MKIKWLGHSAFLITADNNIKIVTDPYTPGNGVNHHPINETADIVTISHAHNDHNNAAAVKGSPTILREKGRHIVKGIEFNSVPVFHDSSLGSQRGDDLVFCFQVGGVVVCHLGDLGHMLSPRQIDEIGPVDVLMVPVGGYFTIDAREATLVAQSLKPRIIIPMHYKTEKIDFPITGLQPFLKNQENIRRLDTSEFEVNRDGLPSVTETVILKPAN